MLNNKKRTFEQHDNEKGSFYRHSVSNLNISFGLVESNLDVDICVIGGGFTGISSALNLAKKGYKVVLVEARKLGWGASGRNGGHLGLGMRKEQSVVEKKLGISHAKELWNLGSEAVTEALNYISAYKIDCNIQNGVMLAGYYPNDNIHFLNEIEHMQKNYQYEKYEYFDLKQIREQVYSKRYYSGLLNKGSYHINPLKLLYGLAKELLKLKVKIFENTPIHKIEETKEGVIIRSKHNIIKASYVVVGCNGYLDNLLGKVRNKFMPINNYIVTTEPIGEENAKKIILNNYAVCDSRFIIDYYRFSEDWRMIFGGGETFTSTFLKDARSYVTKRMYKVFPNLRKYNVDFSWGGTLAITINRLPDFGTLMNDKILYAQGYSGHGLALSILAGKLISEKISGFSNRFDFFESIRHLTIPGGDFLRRPIYATGVAYYKIRDLL
jgi:gamma-glutamylputrescine oxidase